MAEQGVEEYVPGEYEAERRVKRTHARLHERLGDVFSRSGATAEEILARYPEETLQSAVKLAEALKADPDVTCLTGYKRVARELLADE